MFNDKYKGGVDPTTKKRVTAVPKWKGVKTLLFNCAHCFHPVTWRGTFEQFLTAVCPQCKNELVRGNYPE